MIYHRKYKRNVEAEKKVEFPSSLHIGFTYNSVEVENGMQKEEDKKEEVAPAQHNHKNKKQGKR